MANINNPEAIRFINEQVRPLCEELRALKAKFDALSPLWFSGLNTVITNNVADPIMDGRNSEGVSRLSGADVHSAVAQFLAITPNAEIIAKPCVRALQAD